MKASVACFVLLGALVLGKGQGTLYVGNRMPGLSNSPIYGPDPTQPTLRRTGQSATGTPAGTTLYGGALLTGDNWTFAAFAGPVTAAENELALISMTSFGTGQYAGIALVHTLNTVPGVATLQPAKYQIRIWDNQAGKITSWPQAVTAWERGDIALGGSEVMIASRLGGHTNGVIYAPAPTLFSSFNVAFVPEPASAFVFCMAIVILILNSLRLRR